MKLGTRRGFEGTPNHREYHPEYHREFSRRCQHRCPCSRFRFCKFLLVLFVAFELWAPSSCDSLSLSAAKQNHAPAQSTINNLGSTTTSTDNHPDDIHPLTLGSSNGRRQRRRKRYRDRNGKNGKLNNTEAITSRMPPLFSIGMIADIQYAPIQDGASYSGTPRYYRHSLEATKHAFELFATYRWNPRESIQTGNDNQDGSGGGNTHGGIDLVVNLGDIIDGKCQDIERNGGILPDSITNERTTNLPNKGRNQQKPVTHFEGLLNNPGMLSLLEIKNAMKPFGHGPPSTPGQRTVLHSYGNHCLYNLNRAELRETLGIPFKLEKPISEDGTPLQGFGRFSKRRQEYNLDQYRNSKLEKQRGDESRDLVGYYSYVHPVRASAAVDNNSKTSSIKFIVLDSYDIGLIQRNPHNSKKRMRAVEILKSQNGKNFNKGNHNSPDGLEGLQKRFVAFGGGLGQIQLQWLRKELEATRKRNNAASNTMQRVIILSHQPIHPDSCNPVCLIWNYDSVLEILREYNDVVVASFAGHAHKGGYCRDADSGIHFRVIEAVLESKPPTKTFGILHVFDDHLQLCGYGDCESAVYRFDDITNNKDDTLAIGSSRGNPAVAQT